jgi:arylsulfatase A-like enzyme
MNVAFVEHLDDRIGKVLGALEDAGLEKNTIVVFTSDNGGSLHHAQNNDPWRGGKQDHYDGGLRVPFMVRWPGRIQPGTRSGYQGLNFDIFPTFLEIAGVTPSPGLDAVSLLPVLEGATISKPRDLYFVRREGGPGYGGKSYEAIISDGWKLMQNDPYRTLELYHLNSDPFEKQNLVKSHPAVVSRLSPRLRAHIQIGGATPWRKMAPAPKINP